MRAEAVRALNVFAPSAEQVIHYLSALVDDTGMPLCPKCFHGGKSVRMTRMHAAVGYGAARCSACRSTLDWDATLTA